LPQSITGVVALACLGATGAALGGALIYVIHLNFASRVDSLPFWIVMQGLCFIGLGAGVGLSVARYRQVVSVDTRGLVFGMAIGGGLYGAASFLSIPGGVIGLLLFALSVAASVVFCLGSKTLGLMVGLVSLVFIALLVLCLFVSDQAAFFLWALFTPTIGMRSLGWPSVIGLILGFYVFNVIVLLILGKGPGQDCHDHSYALPTQDAPPATNQHD
jgi:hypothetical protein